MKLKLILMMAGIVLLTVGCTGTVVKGGIVKKPHAQFGVAMLPPSWQQKPFRGADLFFEHVNRDATIFVNSECDKVSDSPLEALASQMLVGMGKYEIISQQRLTLNEREALISEVDVELDGVHRYLKIMVLRKNRCVFDAVLSARSYSSELVKDFDDMIATFWAEADL